MESIFAYAYDLLKEINQKTLPVRPDKMESTEYSWIVIPYSEARELFEVWDLLDYSKDKKGFSYQPKIGGPCIFYSDDLSIVERHEVIAHEIGHIYLGHLPQNGIIGNSNNPNIASRQEAEAHAFALALLAPIPLLIAAGIKTPEEIQMATRISKENALIVAGYLSKIYNKPRKKRFVYTLCRKLSKLLLPGICIAVFFGLIFWRLEPQISESALPESNNTYYWTNIGNVYHCRGNCPVLTSSPSYLITSGSLTEAQQIKSQPCQLCIGD